MRVGGQLFVVVFEGLVQDCWFHAKPRSREGRCSGAGMWVDEERGTRNWELVTGNW